MPWKPEDAKRHTRKANTPKKKRQWAHVSDSILERTGDEGRAIRGANAAVKKNRSKRGRMRGRS